MRILIVTDAWRPQVNGVVRTLETVGRELRAMDHSVRFVTPDMFISFPCPTYSEIRLALARWRAVERIVRRFAPDAIHIATEGPLGWAARRFCLKRGYAFTTSFHTRFPEYIQARCGLPPAVGYAVIRRFHRPASRIMVATRALADELAAQGFENLHIWGRGVDLDIFRPGPRSFIDAPRPVLLYVGRVAVEKNIQAFLATNAPGTKIVVGDGPLCGSLRRKWPDVRFVGPKYGRDLAAWYAAADVFVFPSRTDTFGNVMLESLACGTPVAAYPVRGPADVIGAAPVGALDEDLAVATRRALKASRADCRAFAEEHSWKRSALEFLGNLATIDGLQSESRLEPSLSGALSSSSKSLSSGSTTGTE